MLTSLRGFKVFQTSLIFCVPISAIMHPLIVLFGLHHFRPISYWNVLLLMAIGAFIGLFKTLIVSGVSFLGKPSLRWWLIIGSTVALSLLEAHGYYEIWTAPIAHAD